MFLLRRLNSYDLKCLLYLFIDFIMLNTDLLTIFLLKLIPCDLKYVSIYLYCLLIKFFFKFIYFIII